MSDWPTVVAGLGGTSIGVSATWLIESARYRRQRSGRWLDLRRDLSARFLSAADEIASCSLLELPTNDRERDKDAKATAALNLIERLVPEIQLVCAVSERDAAVKLFKVASAFYFRGFSDEPEDKLGSALRESRAEYLSVVRSALAPSSP
jgi:hypothetical protein